MSSGEAADNREDPGHLSFIIMRDTGTSGGQERVMSRAAYDLQVLATSHSASCGHPGFVPDDYLEHLDGLAIETTITAAELCTAGMWERVDGGYRVLDWEAVEVCLDHVRQRRGEDRQALAWEREREALAQAQMAQAMVVTPPCAVCGTPSARIELVAPGRLPAGWEQWPRTVQDSIQRQRQPGQWYLLFKGVAADNGYGDPIDASRAGRIAQAFRSPACFAQVHTAGFYDDAGFCQDCDAPYCYQHWNVSEPAMATAPAAMARAWTRTGRHRMDPVHDPAYYDDLAGRLYGLVIAFSGRLPADQAQWLHHVIDVGEYVLALEDLAAMLAYDKIAPTDQERGDINALARQMRMDLGSLGWTGR